MKELIGNSKVTDVLPLLEMVAKENGLKLNRLCDFRRARILLEERYILSKVK